MKKWALILGASVYLLGCAQTEVLDDEYDQENGSVKIYSTNDIHLAQIKADSYCGKHSFYLKAIHDDNITSASKYSIGSHFYNYIPFQCNVSDAASAGNPEAKKIHEKQIEDAYNSLEKAKQHQYEVHKAYAKKHGSDVYSIVNPDGSIEAHSFDSKGKECHSTSSQFGAEVYCD